jgi:hypothetical protein
MGITLPKVDLTSHQFRTLLKRRVPWHPSHSGSELVTVARRKDGSYWAEWRGSAVFWASRWYEIPKAAGDRVFAFNEAVEELLS